MELCVVTVRDIYVACVTVPDQYLESPISVKALFKLKYGMALKMNFKNSSCQVGVPTEIN